MRNEEVEEAPPAAQPEPVPEPEPKPLPSPAPPLLILFAADGDAVCVDELCLPAEAHL